jgi:2-oxoglutarate dehydrogenase E2 component (dihydrolipoamide succinyltransferase)
MATSIEVPPLGESVTQAILVKWHKPDGQAVNVDEPLCELETDKANVDIPAKVSGILRRLKNEGDTVAVGEALASIEAAGAATGAKPAAATAPAAVGKVGVTDTATPATSPAKGPAAIQTQGYDPADYSPAVRSLLAEHKLDPKSIRGTGPGNRLTPEDVHNHITGKSDNGKPSDPVPQQPKPQPTQARTQPPASVTAPSKPMAVEGAPMTFDPDGTKRVPMSKIRKKIAERLLQAQSQAAILTTFNEVDLTEVMSLRSKFKEQFEKTHGVGLGFMSFFARACVLALRELPRINAFIDGDDIVYHNHVHLGIAVSTDRGLAVPVLRNVQDMSFARIESEIKRLATATREGKLSLEELSGGTFSITNGGVFGSLLSTPILNPPQSGILGMHTIQKRPVVINDKVEVRSMMYLALSYDHRIVDGKEAITFLVRLKQLLEDPARLMLEI